MSLVSFFIPVAHAASGPDFSCSDFLNAVRYGDMHFLCIPLYIQYLTLQVVKLTGSIALLMLMYNGFRWMLGPVTEGSTDAAKKAILYCIIGLIVSLLTYTIIDTVVSTVTQ